MPRVDVYAEEMMLRIVALVLVLSLIAAPSDARPRRHASHNAEAPAAQATAPDDLYRRRGYGTGGLLFGNTAQASACADLAFARPQNCGPKGGYGLYGNGLGYGF